MLGLSYEFIIGIIDHVYTHVKPIRNKLVYKINHIDVWSIEIYKSIFVDKE